MSAEKTNFQQALELDEQASRSNNFWDRLATRSSPALVVDAVTLRREQAAMQGKAAAQTSPRPGKK
ncbi:MAG TPA: hypothetical protein VGV92_09430 [Gammaproteobacteria bacterium]|nr:hypothetical protein [Gammaproteobacteria bacterium]